MNFAMSHFAAPRVAGFAFCALALFAVPIGLAQDPTNKPEEKTKLEDAEAPPVMWGEYEVHSSTDLGGVFTDFSGSPLTQQTFVNQRDGFRILGQSLDLFSPKHDALLFDELHMNSYGYFGDPNSWSRLSVSKHRWYNFAGSFRRDLNFWDYNLLANPLNPAVSNPSVPVQFSPHAFHTTRRIQDYRLTLLPQSRVRVRLGYGRNTSEGPSFSSVHEGTEALLNHNLHNTLDNYNVGVDVRVAPKTNVSYDFFVSKYKGDNNWGDAGFQVFNLAGGIPVDLGLPFNTPANQPCAAPILGSGLANPACNGYLAYGRSEPTRNLYPTNQLTFQSSYIKRVDISGRINYSNSTSDLSPNNFEAFNGLITRSRERSFLETGPAKARRDSLNGDLGVTIFITDWMRFVDTFRYTQFRIPGVWNHFEAGFFGATLLTNPNVFNPATCPGTPATCPQHSASSGPDVISEDVNRFLGQRGPTNTVEMEFDITKRFGTRVGYRYANRTINQSTWGFATDTFYPTLPNRGLCAGQPLVAGVCTVQLFNGAVITPTTDFSADSDKFDITEHSLLAGLWARPVQWWRTSFDYERFFADNIFTRISPRDRALYRIRSTAKPKNWMVISGSLYWLEQKQPQDDVQNRQHNRVASGSMMLSPNDIWSLSLDYNYQNIFSTTNICFVSTPVPPNTPTCGAPYFTAPSIYDSTGHFVSAQVMMRPIKPLHLAWGYTLSSVDGKSLLLNPNAPPGPLRSNYHLPTASVAYDFTKRWTGHVDWNFYQYGEKTDPGLTGFRNFRGSMFTTAVRYSF